MKRLFCIALLLAFLPGCAGYYASRLTTSQIKNAATLVKAYKGTGCVCATGDVKPPASDISAQFIGAIGGIKAVDCAKICVGLRK